jgi:(1->4)-alpha-D-glucan 1-alpha-D-glucosylmutase
MKSAPVPLATYRLQFNKDFTFAQATEIVSYLADLGISHCYASPYLRARPGSTHGYDIIDHNHLNPEIGSDDDFDRFVSALHAHGMGQILDVVPNHMGVMGSDNVWWLDVLENGEASEYAEFFDIDWCPLKNELHHKVLIPVLGDQYGAVLDRGELHLTFDQEKGEFSIFYNQHCFPVNPREYPRILGRKQKRLRAELGQHHQDFLELQSLITAFHHLPGREQREPEKVAERLRDKEIHKKRLATLCQRSAEICQFIEDNVQEINGVPGDPASFNELHELIKGQASRLAYWRVAADDINYRRFFDINDLAALRMENQAVFDATHRFVLQLLKEGKLNGLRIDHPDGLYNPAQYFQRLQSSQNGVSSEHGVQPAYIVIEKILTGDEKLPEEWPISGTTGYEFSNLVNGLFVDPSSGVRMDRIYRAFVGRPVHFESVVYRSKKLVMHAALASEVNVLANLLSQVALSNRHTCDFTVNSLRDALSEVIAWFPVYRTYVTENRVSDTDREYITLAVARAKSHSAASDTSVFDFVRDALLTRLGEGQSKSYRAAVVRFAMKFQQLTSAVMAKGLEDTAFYRYNRLVSLNDVGGDPRSFGVLPGAFHEHNLRRLEFWPGGLLETSTHDSKRSEDVRARINVLSEIPAVWRDRIQRWKEFNKSGKSPVEGRESPSRNDEYLFYQTLAGAWPLDGKPDSSFLSRITDYMLKAVREAKSKTSWANQDNQYEQAVASFVEYAFSCSAFLEDFRPLQRYVLHFGMLNGLSQTLLKLTSPGVPNVYQGNELWEFSLVDPDNRRAVDYSKRRFLLEEIKKEAATCCEKFKAFLRGLCSSMGDGRIKLYLIWRVLNARRESPPLFQNGDYIPLGVHGGKANHLVAFARTHGPSRAIVVVPRLIAKLMGLREELPLGGEVWGDTLIELPPNFDNIAYRNILTSEIVRPCRNQNASTLCASEVLRNFPVSLLLDERIENVQP